MGDRNVILDSNIDREGVSRAINNTEAKYFCEFVKRLDLVDKFRVRHSTVRVDLDR